MKKVLSIFWAITISTPLYSVSTPATTDNTLHPHTHTSYCDTLITCIDDIRVFQGQVVAYTTDNPNLTVDPATPIQYAVVTPYITSDQSRFAYDLFPIVAPGLQNFQTFALSGVNFTTSNIRMRRPFLWEHTNILYALTHYNLFFACDLFAFERQNRINQLMDILDSVPN